MLRLDLLRPESVAPEPDDEFEVIGGNLPDRRVQFIRSDGASSTVFVSRAMPNTMPGLCIERLRPVATMEVHFTRKRLSGGNL